VTTGLVIVLAVAAAIPLVLGFMPRLPLPGPVVEIVAGVVIGPTVLAWVQADETIRALSVLGLSFLLFLAGFEVDVRRFRGHAGRGVLVRTLDPEPELAHPRYPVKLEAIGFGLLIPVFFVTSGMTLDISGLVDKPAALAAVPIVVAALLLVRGMPVLVFRRELSRAQLTAVALLQATSLPFLLTVSQIGIEMGSLDRGTGAAMVAAGVASVLLFPPLALRLLASGPGAPSPDHQVSALDGRRRTV